MDISVLRVIAQEAAAEAAALLLGARGAGVQVHCSSTEQGIVTELDQAAESCIREVILSQRPGDGFLGEEFGATAGVTEVEWIVDPLDGTNNYVAGLPQWAVSIGARVNGRIQLGVVNLPVSGTVYTAVAGAGAWRNDEPLQPKLGRAAELGQAVVATGFSSSRAHRRDQVEQLSRVLERVRDVRCQGAAAVELCAVAVGEVDAYYESGLRLWDVAAGGLVAIETGLDVSGCPWRSEGTLVVGPAPLVSTLRDLVDPSSGCG